MSITFTTVLSTSLDAFDAQRFRERLAALLGIGVRADDVMLTLSSGSVICVAEIRPPRVDVAEAALATLAAIVSSPNATQALTHSLGVVVADVQPPTRVVQLSLSPLTPPAFPPAPSPQSPPASPPHSPPALQSSFLVALSAALGAAIIIIGGCLGAYCCLLRSRAKRARISTMQPALQLQPLPSQHIPQQRLPLPVAGGLVAIEHAWTSAPSGDGRVIFGTMDSLESLGTIGRSVGGGAAPMRSIGRGSGKGAGHLGDGRTSHAPHPACNAIVYECDAFASLGRTRSTSSDHVPTAPSEATQQAPKRGAAATAGVLGSWCSLMSSAGGCGRSGRCERAGAAGDSESSTAASTRHSRSRTRGGASSLAPRPSLLESTESKTVPWDEVTLHESIGHGAFGEVFSAEYAHTRCALKKLRGHSTAQVRRRPQPRD